MATKSNMTKDQAVALARRAQRRSARERFESRQTQVAIVRKGSLAVGAGIIGGLKRAGVPNAIAGTVPWKLPAWLILLLGEAFIDNDWLAAVCGGFGDATLATFTDRAISLTSDTAPWYTVAGDESAGDLPG